MHRIVVNLRTANIFKRIFETHNSTQNEEKNAENRAWETRLPGVYHACVNYDAAPGRIYGMFRSVQGAAGIRKGGPGGGRACRHPATSVILSEDVGDGLKGIGMPAWGGELKWMGKKLTPALSTNPEISFDARNGAAFGLRLAGRGSPHRCGQSKGMTIDSGVYRCINGNHSQHASRGNAIMPALDMDFLPDSL